MDDKLDDILVKEHNAKQAEKVLGMQEEKPRKKEVEIVKWEKAIHATETLDKKEWRFSSKINADGIVYSREALRWLPID